MTVRPAADLLRAGQSRWADQPLGLLLGRVVSILSSLRMAMGSGCAGLSGWLTLMASTLVTSL